MNNNTTLRGRKAWRGYPAESAAFLDKIYKEKFLSLQQKRAFVDALRTAGIAPSLGLRPHVLDVGCGTGEITVALHDAGYEVTGVDTSPAMLKHCRENLGDRAVSIVEADLFEWYPEGSAFDAATARWVFAFYPDFRLPLAAVAKLVKPGGVIVFESCAREAIDNVAALYGLDPAELTDKVFVKSLPKETGAELSTFCDANGMRLEQRRPSTFWHQNPLLVLGFDDHEDYSKEMDDHVAKADVQAFIKWFDSRISRTLGAAVTGSVINVVRKL